jgi:voltage-gated potassium channel
MQRKVREQRRFLKAWSEKTMLPLAFASILYMVAYALEVLFVNDGVVFTVAEAISTTLWFIFAGDVFMRFFNRANLSDFFKTSWIELVALLLPIFRFLRILRLLIPIKALGNVASSRMKAMSLYTAILLPIIIFLGAVAIVDAENGTPDSKLTNFKSALWWSFTTLTGNGDPEAQPLTDGGKVVTTILITAGIVLVSVGAGVFASWILGESKPEPVTEKRN